MFFVYVLYCQKSKKLYIGFTHNLKKRINQHYNNNVYSTKRLGDCKLIFYETFLNKKDAQRREKYLKTTKGKRTLRLTLKNYFKIINY